MSREAWGDPPDREPEFCPNCGADFYTPGCTHCAEVKRRVAAEAEVLRLRAETVRLQGLLTAAHQIVGELARPSGI